MAKSTQPPRPTDAELEILKVLWASGPSTVRQVHEIINRERPAALNTVLTFLQIMTVKGLVVRDSSHRPQVYRPAVPESRTQRKLVEDFVDRVFGGSVQRMVAAMVDRKVSKAELDSIRQLIETRQEEKE
jgi:BlaI family transcriptional regulator, penicillinase repressor